MKIWAWTAIACLVLLGLRCSPSRAVAVNLALPVDEVVSRVRSHDQQIATLKGSGNITVESPEASNSGSFDVDLKKPDSLRVDLSGPFGIHVGTLMISRERYLFYNARENTATVGTPDGTTLQSMFRVRLKFDEILRAFTGEFLTTAVPDSLDQFAVRDNLYLLRYRARGGIQEYRVDPALFVVTSYRFLMPDGKPEMIALASRFDDGSPVVMPRLVRVILPEERRSVTIAYSDIALNEPVECSFPLPRQAEIYYR